MVDQGPAKVIVTKKETSKEPKPAGPSKGTSREPEPAGPSRCDSKELCTDSNSADPQQRKTTGCVSPSAQSGDDAKEPLSWDEEVNTKSDNEGTSDDSVGKSVSTKAKLKGDKGRIASDPPSRCARDISSKSCIDSTSAKPSGGLCGGVDIVLIISTLSQVSKLLFLQYIRHLVQTTQFGWDCPEIFV